MTPSAQRGATTVMVLGLGAILLSVGLFLMTLFITDTSDITKFLIRFGVTIWLVWALMKGRKWGADHLCSTRWSVWAPA